MKYDNWLAEIKDSPQYSTFDVKVTAENTDALELSFVVRVEIANGKTEDFDVSAIMKKSADGWRIASMEIPEPPPVEAPKVEEKKVETPKVEEKKVETPKVEEKKVETSEKPPDDKAQAIAVLVEFHESITKKEYHRAYDCFSDAYKNRVPYDGWAPGFKTTVSSSALDIKVTDASADTITLNYNLRAVDDPGGTRNFNCNVVMVKTANGWKINATSNKLK